MKGTAKSSLGPLVSSWQAWGDYWFKSEPTATTVVSRLRVAVCLVVAVWFLSFLPQVNSWFGKDGLVSIDMAAKLIDFEERPTWQHWSPLWWLDQPQWIMGYLAVAAVGAIVAAFGVGGRYLLLAVLLLAIGWIHRLVWLQGNIEPLIFPFLTYLVLAAPSGNRGSHDSGRLLDHLSVRLFQTHWWMVFAVGWLSQLANIDWWQGDAAWWLAAYGRSHVLSLEALSGNAWLVNAITHSLILTQMIALWLLLIPAARWLGIAATCIALLGIGLLADQTLYALMLAAGLLAFVPVGRITNSSCFAVRRR